MLGISFVVIFEDSAHACADSIAESADSLRRLRTACPRQMPASALGSSNNLTLQLLR